MYEVYDPVLNYIKYGTTYSLTQSEKQFLIEKAERDEFKRKQRRDRKRETRAKEKKKRREKKEKAGLERAQNIDDDMTDEV